MGESRPSCINNLPRAAHAAVISGQTGCGKTAFILDLLEKGPYRGVFHHIVILCPTIRHNAGLLIMNVSFAILTKDELIKQKIIPPNIA